MTGGNPEGQAGSQKLTPTPPGFFFGLAFRVTVSCGGGGSPYPHPLLRVYAIPLKPARPLPPFWGWKKVEVWPQLAAEESHQKSDHGLK